MGRREAGRDPIGLNPGHERERRGGDPAFHFSRSIRGRMKNRVRKRREARRERSPENGADGARDRRMAAFPAIWLSRDWRKAGETGRRLARLAGETAGRKKRNWRKRKPDERAQDWLTCEKRADGDWLFREKRSNVAKLSEASRRPKFSPFALFFVRSRKRSHVMSPAPPPAFSVP